MTDQAAAFAAVFVALYAGHQIGDFWGQTHGQACTKGKPGREGRIACASHVATLTAVKAVALTAAVLTLGLRLSWPAVVVALAIDAASHYWADRRTTLERLAGRLAFMGKDEFYKLGQPRPGHDDAPHLGTGACALDQSFHHAFLFAAALIASL